MEDTGEFSPQVDNRELFGQFEGKLTQDLFDSGYVKVSQHEGQKVEEMVIILEDNNSAYFFTISPTEAYINVISENDEVAQYMMDIDGMHEGVMDNKEGLVYKPMEVHAERGLLTRLMTTDADPEMTKVWNGPRDMDGQYFDNRSGAAYFKVNANDALPYPLPMPHTT